MKKHLNLEVSDVNNMIYISGIDLGISFDDVFEIGTKTGKSSKKIILSTWKIKNRENKIEKILDSPNFF